MSSPNGFSAHRTQADYLYPPRVCRAFGIRCGLVVEVGALERATNQECRLQLVNSLSCVLLLNERENLLSAAILARLDDETIANLAHKDH